MNNETATIPNIGNNYGAAHSPESFVEFYNSIGHVLKTTDNNLVMRQEISALGYSRVSRAFADAVIKLIK